MPAAPASLTAAVPAFIHLQCRPSLSRRESIMTSPASSHITSVLRESRSFPPPPAFAAAAHVKSLAEYEALWQRAANDTERYWAEQAESLSWIKRWDKVLVWKEPHARWFDGGKINASVNCLDRHLT